MPTSSLTMEYTLSLVAGNRRMKTFVILCLIASLVRPICAEELRGPRHTDDHLVPFPPSVYDELRPFVYKKLFLTDANYGRMLEFPQDRARGELAVSVNCGKAAGDDQCFVTLTKATKNIGYIREDNLAEFPVTLIEKVRVLRRDAPIPLSTALAIRAAWMKLLQNTRPGRLDSSVVVDGEKIEFWITTRDGRSLKGEISGRPGTSVIKLVNLGRKLAKYCDQPANQRAKRLEEIKSDATALVGRDR